MLLFFAVVSCDSLVLPEGMQVVPPICAIGRPLAGTACSVYCLYGRTLSGGTMSSVMCGHQGSWEGGLTNLPTSCKGIEFGDFFSLNS